MFIVFSKLILIMFMFIFIPELSINLLLISLSLSFLNEIIKSKYLGYIIYIALIIYNSDFINYLPLFLINSNMVTFNIAVFIFSILASFNLSSAILSMSILAMFLSYTNNKIILLNKDSSQIRDSLQEDSLNLKIKNIELENQYKKNEELLILEERNRISRELHDSIGHLISSSIIQLEAIKLTNKDVYISDSLNILQTHLKDGLVGVRNSIHHIYYESLDLQNEIEKLISNTNLKLNLYYSFNSNVLQLKYDILSIIKESITNTIKHSNANTIDIILISHLNFHKLIIKDNGNLSSKINSNGIGLSSIQQLANKYNGVFTYEYTEGFKSHITFFEEGYNENNNSWWWSFSS